MAVTFTLLRPNFRDQGPQRQVCVSRAPIVVKSLQGSPRSATLHSAIDGGVAVEYRVMRTNREVLL
jgi:hypothetical protein